MKNAAFSLFRKSMLPALVAGLALAVMNPTGAEAQQRGGGSRGGGATQSRGGQGGGSSSRSFQGGGSFRGGEGYRGEGYRGGGFAGGGARVYVAPRYGYGFYYGAPYSYGYVAPPPPCGFYDRFGYFHPDPACYYGPAYRY